LKSTETAAAVTTPITPSHDFSNFGSLKSTETSAVARRPPPAPDFSNFGSLKSTETARSAARVV